MVFGVNDQLRIEGVDDPESVQEELVRICREKSSRRSFPLSTASRLTAAGVLSR